MNVHNVWFKIIKPLVIFCLMISCAPKNFNEPEKPDYEFLIIRTSVHYPLIMDLRRWVKTETFDTISYVVDLSKVEHSGEGDGAEYKYILPKKIEFNSLGPFKLMDEKK